MGRQSLVLDDPAGGASDPSHRLRDIRECLQTFGFRGAKS
jgi:hypothetical protein